VIEICKALRKQDFLEECCAKIHMEFLREHLACNNSSTSAVRPHTLVALGLIH
jgi:hypothetical protein